MIYVGQSMNPVFLSSNMRSVQPYYLMMFVESLCMCVPHTLLMLPLFSKALLVISMYWHSHGAYVDKMAIICIIYSVFWYISITWRRHEREITINAYRF